MAVSGPTAPKTANQLAIGLEGEDATRLVVDHNDMSISVYGHPLGAHEAASSNLGLEKGIPIRGFIQPGGESSPSLAPKQNLGLGMDRSGSDHQEALELSPQLVTMAAECSDSKALTLNLPSGEKMLTQRLS